MELLKVLQRIEKGYAMAIFPSYIHIEVTFEEWITFSHKQSHETLK